MKIFKKTNFKKPLIFSLILFPLFVIGGYLATVMSVSSMTPEFLSQGIEQFGSKLNLILASSIMPIILPFICSFFGFILSEKIGLLRPFKFEKSALIKTIVISMIFGIIFSLDAWTFAKWSPELAKTYESTGSFDAITWFSSVLYGGLSEEIMMRLFFMSFLSFAVWKIFFKEKENVPNGVIIGSNIVVALAFAVSHLPATLQTFGVLTPLLIFRCFLMNGAFGLLFGRLYRKYGIQYAVLSHIILHIVSKTIWLIAF
ncbi:MAG: CPBP family intramembrane metalloprotease [Clostridiales bacterium]|nr:CPBP family intramembrane metalloprotease [Clostridiales bacterium]